MANETVVSQINQFIPLIWEGALMYVRFNTAMPNLVRVFADRQGMTPRSVTQWVEGTVQNDLGELEDLTPTLIERELLAQLTPAEHGVQYLITDRRLETDNENVLAAAAQKIGYEMGKNLEVALLNDIQKFTGGQVGTANAALTWADIYNGRARLAAAGVPAPYSVVLHEWQWLDLATAANIVASGVNHSMKIRDEIQSKYYMGSMGDMNFFVSGLLPIDGNGDAVGGIFNREALALDMRRGLRIEPERDASLRATELNATTIYAHGTWQKSWGVKIISDASAAGTNVTEASILGIFGTVDDNTVSSGTDVTLDFVVVNNGAVVTNDIEVTVTVPAGTTYVSDEPTQGSYNSTTRVWTAGSLAPGGTARLRLVYDVTATGNFSATITNEVPAEATVRSTGNIAVTVS